MVAAESSRPAFLLDRPLLPQLSFFPHVALCLPQVSERLFSAYVEAYVKHHKPVTGLWQLGVGGSASQVLGGLGVPGRLTWGCTGPGASSVTAGAVTSRLVVAFVTSSSYFPELQLPILWSLLLGSCETWPQRPR